MIEVNHKQFWYFLIEGQQDNITGVYGNFYSYGEHCGESLYHALKAAKQNNFISPMQSKQSGLII
jgi:hypothetical protein